jgi:hypothetical protein
MPRRRNRKGDGRDQFRLAFAVAFMFLLLAATYFYDVEEGEFANGTDGRLFSDAFG